MNIIKKYWDSVYIYVLLAIPGFCMCAGLYWTICKLFGYYSQLSWLQIAMFDGSQIIYLLIALYFIYQNKKDSSYIPEHLKQVKGFAVLTLFIQYNFIMYLFPSEYVWSCTFIFFAILVFLFDSKLMFINIMSYFGSLLVAHILKPDEFLPLEQGNVEEVIAFRVVICVLTSCCIILIVYFVERFLMQEQESSEENAYLIEKQLEYYKDMEIMDTELRKFRHDIVNHFICMEYLFNSGKTEELGTYFQDLQQSFSFQQKMHFSGNDIVDAILHHDLPNYCREEVKVTTYGSLPNIQTVSAMDMCTLFSNLLSNAITAANQCIGNLEPEITIHFSGGKKYFSIVMSNSTLIQSKVKKKDRNHGFGKSKIKGVMEKYHGNYEQNVENNIMTIKVYLPI